MPRVIAAIEDEEIGLPPEIAQLDMRQRGPMAVTLAGEMIHVVVLLIKDCFLLGSLRNDLDELVRNLGGARYSVANAEAAHARQHFFNADGKFLDAELSVATSWRIIGYAQ